MVPPIEPYGAETILQEAASLFETVQKHRTAGPALVGLFNTLREAYNDVLGTQNKRLKIYLQNNKELVDRAEISLNRVQNILVEMKLIEPEKIEHLEKKSVKDYSEILNGAASCIVMAEKAGKLYDQLSKLRDSGKLRDYLKKYRGVGEDMANFVRPYLKYEEGFREIMKDSEFVKSNMDKIRKALGGLEMLRRSINLLLSLGVVPTGYNLKQLDTIVRRELPAAA